MKVIAIVPFIDKLSHAHHNVGDAINVDADRGEELLKKGFVVAEPEAQPAAAVPQEAEPVKEAPKPKRKTPKKPIAEEGKQ